MAVTSVPASMGKAVEVQAKAAARMRDQPCSIFTTIISTAMIASSTRRPSAMIKAPSVMRFRSIPSALITSVTTASTSGTEVATTMPVRQPSDRKLTPRTITSASAKERRNSETARSTTAGWSAICVTSMPIGIVARCASSASFTSLPKERMFAPFAMTTPTPRAGFESWRTKKLGGSA